MSTFTVPKSDDEFWSDEENLLVEALVPSLIQAAIHAAWLTAKSVGMEVPPTFEEAVAMYAASHQSLSTPTEFVKWGLTLEAVADWVDQYSFNLARGITSTTRDLVAGKIADWVTSGESINKLIKDLEPALGLWRAKAIATTEVTKAFAVSNIAAWNQSGVITRMRWNTTKTDVCPICQSVDGLVVQINGSGFNPDGAEGVQHPPAHVGCRCWLSPAYDIVVSSV